MRWAIWLSMFTFHACNQAQVSPTNQTSTQPAALPPTSSSTAGGDANATDAPADTNDVVDPNHPTTGPTVRLQGRFDASDANIGTLFAWPASAMVTRVLGTGVSIGLSELGNMTYQGNVVHNYYDVFVDEVLTSTFEVTKNANTYIAAQNLAQGDHTIRVVKRTEPQMGTGIFYGFTALGGGQLLPAPMPKQRQIEFIGDSITAGYGADGNVPTGNGCPFTAATENADVTYAAQTAQAFDAEFVATAYSGKGMVQNDDCYGDSTNTLPVLYSSTVPLRSGSTWDFASWKPQVVVINLGTNDYNLDNGCAAPATQTFVNGYIAFLKAVRANYPSAVIFCALGPTLGAPEIGVAQANVQAAVSSRTAAGDANVFYIQLAQMDSSLGYGCAGHPNKAAHAVVAKAVTSAISARLGW